ncbi:MAG: chemotaxis protein CheA [Deltaproteobacteria bacterium]|nr:chemotaxis protein CheA [Deltaproteobacteria bacterium]
MHRRYSSQERTKEFLAEAEDILAVMGRGLARLGRGVKAGVIDPAVLNAIFRCAHTLKGMAGIYEHKEMAGLSHCLEDVLDGLRLGKITLDDEVFNALMGAYEFLAKAASVKGRSGAWHEGIKASAARLAAIPQSQRDGGVLIARELKALLTEYEEHRLRENIKSGRNIFIVNCSFPGGAFDTDYPAFARLFSHNPNSELIAALPSSLSTGESVCFDLLVGTSDDKAAVEALIKGAHGGAVRTLAEGASPVASGPERHHASASRHGAPIATLRRSSNTVRVNIAKLDKMMNIIGELGMLKSVLALIGESIKGAQDPAACVAELDGTAERLEAKLNELRSCVVDIRMVPIGQLFSRFETFFEKLGRDAGKEVKMVVNGEETELDKLIVEELADPLMHIIRNAIDHALEPPVVRVAAGKPPHGVITLSAYQKGALVVVEVKDDGCGIDDALVREKAALRNIAPREYLNAMSRQEAIELIFTPGFSTRDIVDETSGRGIGMDVVRENIMRLSGRIDVETVKGKGTRIILTIPMTLAITKAVIVESAGDLYAVPLSAVIEVMELQRPQSERAGREGVVRAGEKDIPAVSLCAFLRGVESGGAVRYGIIAGLAEHRLCVIVDRLVEETDVIIKPLANAVDSPGVSGTTEISGKGAVPVLDLTGIIEETLMRASPHQSGTHPVGKAGDKS